MIRRTIRTVYLHFRDNEKSRLKGLLLLAFLLRLALILPHGNGITVPYRDQNTYYTAGRTLVEEGYLGVPQVARGPYMEFREKDPRPPGFHPAFHDSMAAVWEKDGRIYGILEWGKPNSFWEPLYPIFSAGLYWAFGDRFFYWRFIHVLMGTAFVLLVYGIGKRGFHNPWIGFLAGLYACFYPHFLFYSLYLMAEGFLLLLLALGMWAYFRLLDEPRWYWAALIGIAFGAFVLTRSFLIAFFPLMLLFILVFLRHKKRWQYAAIAGLTCLLTLAPWVYRNYRLHHQFVFMSTRGGYNIWMRNNPYFIADELQAMGVNFSPERLDNLKYREYLLGYPEFTPEQGELERNRILTEEGIKFIKANPGFFLELCKYRFLWTIGYKGTGIKGPIMNAILLLSYGPVLLGFLLSFLFGWKHLRVALPLWLLVGYFLLFYTLTHEGLRYRVPVDPYMIILAVFSVMTVYQKMVQKKTLKPVC